jgi:Tfp pilus assembly protein PilN
VTRRLDFAGRPFRDYRPVYAVVAAAVLVGSVLAFVNARLYLDYRREVAHTRAEIAALEERDGLLGRRIDEVRTALAAYKVSSLASESRELLRLVSERRFSWTALLHRLERTLPPEVRVARLQPRFSERGEIFLDLSLVGRSRDSVTRTVRALSRDAAFESIELRTESSPEEGVPEGYSFTLSGRFQPGEAR